MNKTYESVLPEGYREAFHIDATSIRTAIALNAAAAVIMIAGIVLSFCIIRSSDISFSMLGPLLFFFFLFLYLAAHELVHGAAYKLMTGQKLTFGITFSAAFCGVPEIYVYRRTALISLLAPFTVFTAVFLGAALLNPGDLYKLLFAILLSIHIGGCAGDLYGTMLFLFRFRSPDALMRDPGPVQTFYIKEN